jgi:hypothetical protein
MNQINRTALPPDDELDGLLRAFFRAERPDPWPAMKAPPPTLPFVTPSVNGRGTAKQSLLPCPSPAGKATRRPLWRSRLALAASVALLLGGTLFLPRTSLRWQAPAGPDAPGGHPTADTGPLKKLLHGETPKKPGAPPIKPMGPMTPPADR